MNKKLRTGVAAVLVAGMSLFGVGCSGQPLTQQQQQNAGNFIFLVIYIGMCQANYGKCPFPLGPSDPPPPNTPMGDSGASALDGLAAGLATG